MPREGQTGTLPDGTPVIFMGGQVRRMNEGGLAVMGGGYYESPQGRKYREGPKGGFAQVAGPTQSQVDDYAKSAGSVNNALTALDRLDRQLGETKTVGPMGWLTNNEDLTVLTQTAKDLQLRLKEKPYNLGVLNGPDYEIIQKIVENPDSVKAAAFRKSLAPALRNLARILGDQYRSDMSSYRSVGGRSAGMPALYRSPNSQYTPDQWGNEGSVPPNVYKGVGGQPRATQPAMSAPAKPGSILEYDERGRLK